MDETEINSFPSVQRSADNGSIHFLQENASNKYSFATISSWIEKCGHKIVLASNNKETFVDKNGIKRYTNSWKPVIELSEEELVEKTGCLRVNIQHSASDKLTEIDLLNDWQRMWAFLLEDEEDEIAKYVPLLRHLVETCFHRRTCQIMFWLSIYNMLCNSVAFTLYPKADQLIYPVTSFFNSSILFIVYFACVMLNKGRSVAVSYLFGDKPDTSSENNFQTPAFPSTEKIPTRYYSVHWTATIQQLLQCARQETKALFNPNNTDGSNRHYRRKTSTTSTISFYRILNLSLKVLSRYNRVDIRHSNLDRPTYRVLLLFVVFGLPFYVYFYQNIVQNQQAISECVNNFSGSYCQDSIWYFALTCGFLTKAIAQYIFASSVMVTIIGLAHAGEIVYQLVNSWIAKFRSLRRIQFTDTSCFIVSSSTTTIQKDKEEFPQQPDGKQEEIDSDADSEDDTPNKSSETPTISPLVQHLPSVIPIRKIQDSSFGAEIVVEVQQQHEEEEEENPQEETIFELVKRDAIEHYLLLREVVRVLSEIWSPALTGFFFLNMYAVISYLIYFIIYDTQIQVDNYVFFVLYVFVRVNIYFIYPILSISHANAYIYEIKEMFAGTALDDFLILGGREYWIAFVEACPIVWTYYGIWITWDRLEGLLYTGVAGLIALVTSVFTASSFFGR